LFIEDGGYEKKQYWSRGGWQWLEGDEARLPRYWRDARRNCPNQPVVGITYWEAEAFCAWAGGRLPGEREWESAARGPEGYMYPWGNDWQDGICNSAEAGLEVTTPVGLFPKSRSNAFGLEDMAGNVWQWCSDPHERWGRVLRGGSFGSNRPNVRSPARNLTYPTNWWNSLGFRVARTYD
jgi:formylglycine-generating enzyme required for sulfatase activity